MEYLFYNVARIGFIIICISYFITESDGWAIIFLQAH